MKLSLLTDLYEITMLAAYLNEGMEEKEAAFDLFFRAAPFQGSHAVFAGLEPVLHHLERLRFDEEDLRYLESLGLFGRPLLSYLKGLRFQGRLVSVREGSVVFAGEPFLTVEGSLGETQIIETVLLNLVNFQSLVATKASRIVHEAGERPVVDFGARRAHGPDGALGAARAAFVGGVRTTSLLSAGRAYGIPVAGTQAHSWVMAFPTELEAFRAYARAFPDHCVLLVDTYDTLRSGIPNAIRVARELREQGHELRGIRLDSGDLAYLSREARRMLDEAGFSEVRILASNEIDEQVIDSIRKDGGRVDQFGVGTRLVTAAGEGGGALGGVYKLVELEGQPRIKVSADREKSTLPGRKRLWRAIRGERFEMDVVAALEETPRPGDLVLDPANPLRRTRIPEAARLEEIRSVVMEKGRRTLPPPPLEEIADFAQEQLRRLPEGCRRLVLPHRYRVALTRHLHEKRFRMIQASAASAGEEGNVDANQSQP